MRLMKVVTLLSIAVVVAGLAVPASAQKKDNARNPYLQADIEDEATRVDVHETSIGTLIRYKDQALPEQRGPSTNWPLYGMDLSNSRYILLDQINTSNAKRLTPVWVSQQFTTGNVTYRENNSSQVAPTVVDGVVYTSDFPGNVYAVNAETGRPIWTFRINTLIADNEVPNLGGNKGVIYGDGVLYTTAGATIIALDPKTGQPVETFGNKGRVDAVRAILLAKYPTLKTPSERGYFYPNAVQYYKGIIIGVAGVTEATPSPTGGLVHAIDAKTGRTLWFFRTVPQDRNDQGWDLAGPTWVGDGPRTGGTVWQTPAIDPDLGLLYVNAANPSPLPDGSKRNGLNLFTDSIIALDVATGKMKAGWGFDYSGDGVGDGFFQATHHDIWDYDFAQQNVLFDVKIGGKTVKALAAASKNGLLYMLDRTTGKPLPGFSIHELPVPATSNRPRERPWPTQPYPFNAFGQIMATVPLVPTDIPQERLDAGFVSVPHYTPPLTITNAQGVSRQILTPNTGSGGQTGAPAACSMRTGMLYFAGIDNPSGGNRPGRAFITAWDMVTGELVWTKLTTSNVSAGAGGVATSGDLLFVGESNGIFHAYDARTGEELWNFYTGGNLKGSPTVYMVNGREYVTIKSAVTLFTFALSN